MSDPAIGANQCQHGQLARVCEMCELKARLAECERGNEQAERNYERARDSVLEAASHLKVCRFEVMGLTAERDTLRAQLTETQKLLEREQTIARIERKELDALRKQYEQTAHFLSVQLAVGDKLEAEVFKAESKARERDMFAEEWKRRAKEKEAELAALREALEAVDAWDIRWADGLDSNVERIKKIVRDALGRLDASPSALAQNSHPVANMSADSEAPTE